MEGHFTIGTKLNKFCTGPLQNTEERKKGKATPKQAYVALRGPEG
jgi:hypothetical protein